MAKWKQDSEQIERKIPEIHLKDLLLKCNWSASATLSGRSARPRPIVVATSRIESIFPDINIRMILFGITLERNTLK